MLVSKLEFDYEIKAQTQTINHKHYQCSECTTGLFELIWKLAFRLNFHIEYHFFQVEKEIGQVWRQMGIMYSQVSNSIDILEKVSV